MSFAVLDQYVPLWRW